MLDFDGLYLSLIYQTCLGIVTPQYDPGHSARNGITRMNFRFKFGNCSEGFPAKHRWVLPTFGTVIQRLRRILTGMHSQDVLQRSPKTHRNDGSHCALAKYY